MQYQIRLLLPRPQDGAQLIYAPRDDDRYVREADRERDATGDTTMIQVHGRLSKERVLIRKLEARLAASSSDNRKSHRMLNDKLRNQHKEAMQRIIVDVQKGLSAGLFE